MITGVQVREARALLKWGQWRLAKATYLSAKTIARVERDDGVPDMSLLRLTNIQTALETAGVEFLSREKPGVRLRKTE